MAICFSFGNDLKTYCYGKDVEPLKKALHYAIFFDSYELSDALIGIDLRPIQKCATRQEKYLLAKRLIKAAYSNNNTPPQCSKVGKDSDAYRLQSYERQTRTSEIAFQKKNSTRLNGTDFNMGYNEWNWKTKKGCLGLRAYRTQARCVA